MPVEIRELIIRATVEEDPAAVQRGRGQPANGAPAPGTGAGERARLIAECLDHVAEMQRDARER